MITLWIVSWVILSIIVNIAGGIFRIKFWKENPNEFYKDEGEGWNPPIVIFAHLLWPGYLLYIVLAVLGDSVIIPFCSWLCKFYKSAFENATNNESELEKLREEIQRLRKEKEE